MQQVRVLEGCEEFSLGSGPVGALLLHGFTGSPDVFRELGPRLADSGVAVTAPRLPGHGTTWEDLATRRSHEWADHATAALDEMTRDRDRVFVVGLSFGGALALHLAAEHPDRVAGVVVLATFLETKDPRRFFVPLVRHLVKSIPGPGNDIADPTGRELAYSRVPTHASLQMLRFVRRVRSELAAVKCPILVMHGRNDHVAHPGTAQMIMDRVGSTDKELVWLERSYHVVTLDYDRQEVFDRTIGFIKKRSADGRV